MDIVFDTEADSLNPTKIWIFHAIDVETQIEYTFYPYRDPEPFRRFSRGVSSWVCHNAIGFDVPALNRLYDLGINPDAVRDTLVLSRLIDFNRPGGHSLAQYGREFGLGYEKIAQEKWDEWDDNFIERVKRDVQINLRLYHEQLKFWQSPRWREAIRTEHWIAHQCIRLHEDGFHFDAEKGRALAEEVRGVLAGLTEALGSAFPPWPKFVRLITPKETKHGTLSKVGLQFAGADLTGYSPAASFSLLEWVPFNPASAPQRVERLWAAGWKPTEKTEGYKDFEKELRDRRRQRRKDTDEDKERLERYKKYGWKTSEENLQTLPEEAPPSAKTLVRWMLLRSRLSKLDKEWLPNVQEDGRIHGTFNGLGAWTGRMSHDNPNMGNVPKFNAKRPATTPYSDQMRALWGCPSESYLVGVDAESIQLRVLAHYIDDYEFTQSLLVGRKEDKTDPHSVNQRALGEACTSRDDAKTFIYAWVLGASEGKVAEILKCSRQSAAVSVKNFLDRYDKLCYVKDKIVPQDAANKYFIGFDGRAVKIPGEDQSSREHFALAGYLQSGEAIIMKRATQIWIPRLQQLSIPFKFVNFVHDEFQLEVPRDMTLATHVAQIVADSIRQVGEDLNLRCPMKGSILNAHDKLAIGDNWLQTH